MPSIRYQTTDGLGVVIQGGGEPIPPLPGTAIVSVDTIPAGNGPLRWDAANNALVRDPVPDMPVPTLTARQLRLWILGNGMTLQSIDAQIASIPDATMRAKAEVEWDYASEYRHNHPLVIQIGSALGMTQVQIDTAFRAAALL